MDQNADHTILTKASHIALFSVAGTSLMTWFSYIISEKENQNFKEPKLLGKLLRDSSTALPEKYAFPGGWIGHYAVGTNFAMGYWYLFREEKIRPSLKNGLIFGILSGITGIMAWKIMFKMHSNPPYIPFRRFGGHLLVAHIVYAMAVLLADRAARKI